MLVRIASWRETRHIVKRAPYANKTPINYRPMRLFTQSPGFGQCRVSQTADAVTVVLYWTGSLICRHTPRDLLRSALSEMVPYSSAPDRSAGRLILLAPRARLVSVFQNIVGWFTGMSRSYYTVEWVLHSVKRDYIILWLDPSVFYNIERVLIYLRSNARHKCIFDLFYLIKYKCFIIPHQIAVHS